jgi:RimJ/RimL family protein N-acetyltransferase
MTLILFEPLDASHAEALHDLWSDREVVRFTNWESSSALEETCGRIERLSNRYASEPHRLGPYAVRDGEFQFVGLIGIDHVDSEHELWYLVRRDRWGRGYGSAMVARMIDEASARGFGRLAATAVAANTASWRLLERHGFERVATLVEGFRRHGVTADLHCYERRLPAARAAPSPCPAWDDLVLPDAQLQQLREIVALASSRPGDSATQGRQPLRPGGTLVLLTGAAGTGKSLAAKALADALQQPLLRVDLAQVAGRYIGETEKNLDRVFDAARQSGAVLLLDEADALLDWRGEVEEAHDRHANLVASGLLQRLEGHPGLAIVVTRSRGAPDPAFARRMAAIVEFPRPDAPAREAIWRRHLPAVTGPPPLDYARLARMNIDGRTIRNIAVRARFLAAASNAPATLSLVLEAAAAERGDLGADHGPARSFDQGNTTVMTVDPQTLDRAYAMLEEFGPELSLPRPKRLEQHFPQLSDEQAREVLEQVARVSKTVWSLAERGGAARLGRDTLVAELQAAHPFLREAGLDRARFLVNYYAWHEGYDR